MFFLEFVLGDDDKQDDVYDCPMYSTTFRGPTYIVLATLKSVDPIWKWVLAGVAMIAQEDL